MKFDQRVILVFFLAFVIRFAPLPESLFFGPEQGRDMLATRNIVVNHKPTLIGAKTDIEGIFHGPLFYYLLVIPFVLFSGSPVGSTFFTVAINTTTLLGLYVLGKKLFTPRVGWLAVLLFAFSYRAIDYARWLSAPALTPTLVVILLLSLWYALRGSYLFLYILAIVSGMLIQLQLLHAYLVPPLVFVCFLFLKPKISAKHYLLAVLLFSLFLLPFAIFDLRHDHLISKAVVATLSGQRGFAAPLSTSLRETTERFTQEVVLYLSPGFPWIALPIFFTGLLVCWQKRTRKAAYRLLTLALLIPLLILATSRHSVLAHFFLFLSPMVMLLSALALDIIWRRSSRLGALLLLLLLFINLNSLRQLKPWGITLSQEKKIIEAIYQDAQGEDFRYEAFTFPYFWKDAWEYLFIWYGQPRYHYLPKKEGVSRVYFIWEEEGTPYQRFWYSDHVVPYGDSVMRVDLEAVHVERREKPQNKK